MSLWKYMGAGSTVTKWLYHLDGNSNDSSGNANNGTDTNISYVDWKILQCASWSATWYISLPLNIIWNWDYTIAQRVNITTRPANGANYVLYHWSPNSNFPAQFVDLTNINGNATYRVRNRVTNTANSEFQLSYESPYADYENVWSWIVATKISNVLHLYINGDEKGTPVTVTWTANTDDFKCTIWAAYFWSYSSHINGKIDELIIENRAWTAAEVRKFYTYSKWRFGIL